MFAQPESSEELTRLEQREAPVGELHLRFYLPSGRELAIPATGIREVLASSPQNITPIPNASYLLLGTMNLRGSVIWVADLGQFLGEMDLLTTDRGEIPVIAIEDREMVIGLAVERIGGMDWLDSQQLHSAKEVPDAMAPFVGGEWLFETEDDSKGRLSLLDPGAIVRSARWAT